MNWIISLIFGLIVGTLIGFEMGKYYMTGIIRKLLDISNKVKKK